MCEKCGLALRDAHYEKIVYFCSFIFLRFIYLIFWRGINRQCRRRRSRSCGWKLFRYKRRFARRFKFYQSKSRNLYGHLFVGNSDHHSFGNSSDDQPQCSQYRDDRWRKHDHNRWGIEYARIFRYPRNGHDSKYSDSKLRSSRRKWGGSFWQQRTIRRRRRTGRRRSSLYRCG